MLRYVPNLLSASRLAMAPWVAYLIAQRRYREVLPWFAAAAITDALDGFLARRWTVSSRAGQLLDPIADKALLTTVFLSLAIRGDLPWWLAALVVARDVLLLLASGILLARATTKRSFPPSIWGKLSTIAQMGCVMAVILDRAGLPLPLVSLFWITAAVTVWSGLDYARRAGKSNPLT